MAPCGAAAILGESGLGFLAGLLALGWTFLFFTLTAEGFKVVDVAGLPMSEGLGAYFSTRLPPTLNIVFLAGLSTAGLPFLDEEEGSVSWALAGTFVASNVPSSSLVGCAAMSGSLGSDLLADLIADASSALSGDWVTGLIPEGDAPGGAAAMLENLGLDLLAGVLALGEAFFFESSC